VCVNGKATILTHTPYLQKNLYHQNQEFFLEKKKKKNPPFRLEKENNLQFFLFQLAKICHKKLTPYRMLDNNVGAIVKSLS
jgi:hypothetical protein